MSSDPRRRIHCLRPLSDVPEAARTEPRPSGLGGQLRASRPIPSSTEPADARAAPPSRRNGAADGNTAASISQAIVRLVRTRTGRGPTKAKTSLSADLAIVTLGEYLTAAEKTLVRDGHSKLARQFRTTLHDGMRADAVAAVEEITGRQVAAYLTAHQHDPELAMIAFHFSPPAHLTRL